MKKISFFRTWLYSLFISAFYLKGILRGCFLVLLCLMSHVSLSAEEISTEIVTTENAIQEGDKEKSVAEVTKSNSKQDGNKIIDLRDNYIGIFVGGGKMYNKHTDVEGFANWGKPGSSVDYNDTEPVGGILIGKKVQITGIPLLRIEFDGTFGDISAGTNKVDPRGLDETAEADAVWIMTARVGLEEEFGPITLFINGGVSPGTNL